MVERNAVQPLTAANVRRKHALWLAVLMAWLASVESYAQVPVISKGVVAIQRLNRGALFSETFEGDAIDVDEWRIWTNEPEQVELAVEDGRFIVRGKGVLSHNGLWLKHNFPYKDIVLTDVQ